MLTRRAGPAVPPTGLGNQTTYTLTGLTHGMQYDIIDDIIADGAALESGSVDTDPAYPVHSIAFGQPFRGIPVVVTAYEYPGTHGCNGSIEAD